jgi:hypothetical protein
MDRQGLYRLTRTLVDYCIASDVAPPAALVLAVDHADAPTYGQSALACSHHHSQPQCERPRCLGAGTSHALSTAALRPGTHPPGTDKAMMVVRLLSYLRQHWPHTPLLGRGDSHCATPAGRAKTRARPGRMPATAPARRPPASWRTRCGGSGQVPPLSSSMSAGRPPRPSASPAAKSLRRSNSPRTGVASTAPVPARSQRCASGGRPCQAPFRRLTATHRKPRLAGPPAPRSPASVTAAQGLVWWAPCS